jgi:CubicO group peptidase (beta-lactamase class C family)
MLTRYIGFALCATIPTTLAAQQPGDLAPKVDAIFARFGRNTPGCGVGLAKDGKPLLIKGYGAANLEYGIMNTDSTVFESGSVAKQFTSAAIVLLAQDGKLSLDDDVRKYLPEVPAFGGQKITIRHLLTHTSGLRDQWGLLGIEGRGPGTQVHSALTTLDLISRQKMLNFPPGSAYLYSNSGYALAGLIVQRVSGKTLEAFSQERLFKPLGMTHTQWRDDFTEVIPNRATAYEGSPAAGFHTDMPFTNMIGNGGLLSTMSDLLLWNENLDNPKVGGSAFTEALEARMRLTNGRTIPYALGLTVGDYRGVREVSHGGSTAGYRTHLSRFPEQRVSVAVWCNGSTTGPAALLHQVADLVLTFPQATAAQASAERVEVAAGSIARWAGMYRDRFTDQTITLTASERGLTAPGGRGGVSWYARGGATFLSPQGEATFSGAIGQRNFILVREGADTARFEEVRPAGAVRAADYVGTYGSDELDVKLTIVSRNGKLFLTRRPADEIELRAVYPDDFQAPGLGSLRFARDARGAVSGFGIFAGRVLDVRFRRAR